MATLPSRSRVVGRPTLATLAAALLLGCPPVDDPNAPPDPSAWTPSEVTSRWTPSATPSSVPAPASLADLAWLTDVSRWEQRWGPGEELTENPRRPASGTFGLGNSSVFGLIGLDDPWNTLTNAIGPGYQRDGGFFGDCAIGLRTDTDLVPVGARVQSTRDAPVVRTETTYGDLTLRTIDVAAPGQDVILRVLDVGVVEDTTATAVEVTVDLALSDGEVLTPHPDGLLQIRGERQMLVSCDATPTVTDGRAVYALGTLDPGERIELICTHAFAPLGDAVPSLQGSAAEVLEAARAEHVAFLDGGLRLDTPDPAVDDLLTGMLTTLAVQTAGNGIVSPMHRYTSGWLRDAEGPARLYLRSGHDERARAILDGTVASLTARGAIANSFPLTIDTDAVVEPEDPDAFWAQADFMPGRNAAEAPSYGPILHDLYVRTTGDGGILTDARLAFLEQSLLRQDMDANGRLPFSGDETYRWLMSVTIGETVPEEVGWSAGSSMLLAHAAERLLDLGGDAALAPVAEMARAGAASYVDAEGFVSPIRFFDTGGLFPGPYEDVSTQPLWLAPDAPSATDAANVEVLADRLMGDDGVLRSNTLGITGMSHGFWLANLAALDHPDRDLAFDGLAAVATPSGHFEEGHGPDGDALSLAHQPDGMGADAVARYRPWEGGDALAGMLRALIGQGGDARQGRLVLAPRLPNGWPLLAARGLRFAGVRVDLEVEGYDEGQVVRVEREGGHGPAWDLGLSLQAPPGRTIERVFLGDLPFADLPAGAVVTLPDVPLTDTPITLTAVYGSG